MTDSAQPFAAKKFLEINGRSMAYIDEGEGAPTRRRLNFPKMSPTRTCVIYRSDDNG